MTFGRASYYNWDPLSTLHLASGTDMIKRYNNLSLALGVPGIILQFAGQVMSDGNSAADADLILGLLVSLIGTGLLIAGLSYYAIAKGHSGWWGLCGLLSCLGLLILALLKDESVNLEAYEKQEREQLKGREQ